MSSEVEGSPTAPQAARQRTPWRAWLRVAAAALALLAASEALWLWQTWPVRELLQAPSSRVPAVTSP